MLTTVKAVVQGERIEWQEAVENVLPQNERVEVLVTILNEQSDGVSADEKAKRRVAALERLAARGTLSIPDPVEWQRRIREDRDLPGRQS